MGPGWNTHMTMKCSDPWDRHSPRSNDKARSFPAPGPEVGTPTGGCLRCAPLPSHRCVAGIVSRCSHCREQINTSQLSGPDSGLTCGKAPHRGCPGRSGGGAARGRDAGQGAGTSEGRGQSAFSDFRETLARLFSRPQISGLEIGFSGCTVKPKVAFVQGSCPGDGLRSPDFRCVWGPLGVSVDSRAAQLLALGVCGKRGRRG